MLATRPGLARLTDWQAIWETVVYGQYNYFRISSGWTVLDIGAGIGDFSYLARKQGAGRVIAYECDRFCLPALQKNAARYGFEVQAKRVVDMRPLPEADLVKIDIEGGEFDLVGFERYPRIIMEWHTPYGDINTLVDRLRQAGHVTHLWPNRRRGDLGILAACHPELDPQPSATASR